MDDGVLTLLALKPTNLQSLRVWKSGIGIGPMPAVGQLTKLRSLSLLTPGADTAEQALCYVTNPTRLTLLDGFREACLEALDAFCAGIGSDIKCR